MAIDVDPSAPVEALLREHGDAIVSAGIRGELPQYALDAAQDLTGALSDALAAGRQLEQDRHELTQRKDLLPEDGYRRLWGEAHVDAKRKTQEAELVVERAYTRLQVALEDAALPTFAPGREQLARDEAALALSGSGNPETLARQLAMDGNEEALAALVSPWGRTLLASRGVENPKQTMREVRSIAVARALDHGETTAALALRDHFPALGVVKGSAGNATRMLVGGVW